MSKFETEEFKSIFTDEFKKLIEIFNKYNYEIRIAGGAVRDLLMNIKPKDVDLATTALPEQMKDMFNAESIRMLHTNGEKHGTITVRINDKENYEVTTLRIDVTTDGRHAEVEFTRDWKLDANRRDLTVNSIFLGIDGTIYDYFNGLEDLKERRIRFVGEPDQRIKEDYLRILRYFRFYGRLCTNDHMHDQKSLDAIKVNASGLKNIHGERIWVELKKILVGPFGDSLMEKMIELGVHLYIGLPNKPDIDEYKKIYRRHQENCENHEISAVTLACALLKDDTELDAFAKRMRFSNEERKLAEFVIKNRDCEKVLKVYKNLIVDANKDLKIMEKINELMLYQGCVNYLEEINNWKVPVFPVSGNKLLEKGISKGPAMSYILDRLKEIWKESNFESTEKTLLNDDDINKYIEEHKNIKELNKNVEKKQKICENK